MPKRPCRADALLSYRQFPERVGLNFQNVPDPAFPANNVARPGCQLNKYSCIYTYLCAHARSNSLAGSGPANVHFTEFYSSNRQLSVCPHVGGPSTNNGRERAGAYAMVQQRRPRAGPAWTSGSRGLFRPTDRGLTERAIVEYARRAFNARRPPGSVGIFSPGPA